MQYLNRRHLILDRHQTLDHHFQAAVNAEILRINRTVDHIIRLRTRFRMLLRGRRCCDDCLTQIWHFQASVQAVSDARGGTNA